MYRTVVQRSASCASSSSPPGPITALPSTLRSFCSSFVAWSSWRHRTPDRWSFTAGNRYVNILTANYCNARLNWTSKLHFLYFTFHHCCDRVVNWHQFTMRSQQSWNVKYRKCNFVNWYQLGNRSQEGRSQNQCRENKGNADLQGTSDRPSHCWRTEHRWCGSVHLPW